MSRIPASIGMVIVAGALIVAPAFAATTPADGAPVQGEQRPGCNTVTAQQCVELAIDAMGGRAKLAGIDNERLEILGDRLLTEQSYRQAPFLTAYTHTMRTLDFRNGRVLDEVRTTWPQADAGSIAAAQFHAITVATPHAAVFRNGKSDVAGSPGDIERARALLALSPVRLLLTASSAPGLHYESAEMLRATPHSVVAFRWNGRTIKLLINAANHLPDAMEDVRTFDDFWFAWGDVAQRVYFDNWIVIQGVVFPTNRVEERNGIRWRSRQVMVAKFNVALDDKAFAMDPAAAAKSTQSKVTWNHPFDDSHHIALAPGIDFYQGAWSTTIIAQKDGVLVLEAPISPIFAAGVFAKARSLHPRLPLKGVLTTSDSWPHFGGVREAVAEKLPVYVLDLNVPLLDRAMAAPHTLRPDALQEHPEQPRWVVVSGGREIGRGANRVVVYPLRGAATERQYMVYFPARKLLYASDTLAFDTQTHKLYDPELMREVVQAVQREHLDVETVYAMHQAPTPWSEVVKLVAAAMHG